MSSNLEAKKVEVAAIADRFNRAKGAVFVDYRGLTVEEVTGLRNEYRASGIEYVVLKNTLIKRAVDGLGITGLDDYLHGPTAVAFGYDDPVVPAKITTEFIKKIKKTEVKCGVLENVVLDKAGVEALANLPSKEVLLAKMLGSMNAPITGFVMVLSATLKSLLYTLNAVAEKKQEAS